MFRCNEDKYRICSCAEWKHAFILICMAGIAIPSNGIKAYKVPGQQPYMIIKMD